MEKTKYYSEIKCYIASRIRNHNDAEDMTQCVFFEFYQSNNGTDKPQNPKAYLFGIARKLIGDYYRQKDKQPGFLEEAEPEITDKICYDNYSRDFRTKDLIEEINSIILELPPKAREAVELRLIGNFRSKEAAQKANCSIGVFRERLHEGLKIIRKKLKLNSFKQKKLVKNNEVSQKFLNFFF